MLGVTGIPFPFRFLLFFLGFLSVRSLSFAHPPPFVVAVACDGKGDRLYVETEKWRDKSQENRRAMGMGLERGNADREG